jgi:CRISPR-associated endonuclease/helicase Cas3
MMPDESKKLLLSALGLPLDHSPFPWQEGLLEKLCQGELPDSLDIPTGLGKTSVMAIWLVARACGASLPRRLVYVVDRRAVVDQATDVAITLRQWLERNVNPDLKHTLGLRGRPLPISTLRGQYVDNREWLEDPSVPAIIIGTVDMVGSRLLFGAAGR